MKLETIRAFIAASLPADLEAELSRFQEQVKSSLPSEAAGAARWVKPQHMHLTLCFLGDVPRSNVAQISEAITLAGADWAPMDVEIKGIGGFPNLHRPRVLFAGLHAEVARLQQLQEAIAQNVLPHCPQMDIKPFHPHLTLARFKVPQRGRLATSLEPLNEQSIGTWTIDTIELLQSDLRPHGPEYSVLTSVKLNK